MHVGRTERVAETQYTENYHAHMRMSLTCMYMYVRDIVCVIVCTVTVMLVSFVARSVPMRMNIIHIHTQKCQFAST